MSLLKKYSARAVKLLQQPQPQRAEITEKGFAKF